MEQKILRLYGRIPSKKNSTIQIMRYDPVKKKQVPLKFPSKEYTDREKDAIMQCIKNQLPKMKYNNCKIGYTFYWPDNRKADFSNKIESINDMLVKHGFLEDDQRQCLAEYLYVRHEGISKEEPGVLLELHYERNELIVPNEKKLRQSTRPRSPQQQELFKDLGLA